MKILVIPDIHGEPHWKQNYLEHINEVDKCVFLGDYVDNFNEKYKGIFAYNNFLDIINTTEPYKDKTFLLLGNHDLAYCLFALGSTQVSGHQSIMNKKYNEMFFNNKDRLQIGVKLDKWVFSHAGFTKTWYTNSKKVYDAFAERNGNIPPKGPIKLANWFWQRQDGYLLNFSDLGWDMSGDDKCQGPLWVRPNSLFSDMYYPNQIVGHTEIRSDKPLWIKKNGNNVIVVDSPGHNSFLILDTENLKETEQQCELEKIDATKP